MNPTDPTADFPIDPIGPTADGPAPDSALDAGLAAAFGSEDRGSTADFLDLDEEEHAGLVIGGKYELVEAVGKGGMGTVWRARQTDAVKRYVAVKLIKAGLDSREVLARFEAERQALALMDHPNIAKVFDGGLHDGRPFFVMELVKGVPITDFCDARKLTPRIRLELFVQACNAIQHAHQKGVIHRDIKPSNILVALYGDQPVVKVIDFGVAKATGGSLTDRTIDTGLGGLIGTPEYMSPEQASLNNLDIDTRSDVYALGVLLYELLTGTTPVDRKSLGRVPLLEMLRIVREVEAPRPSAKLSASDALSSIAAVRGTEPKALTRLLRSELDWIVLKALEKDRARRYDTANGFAADVQRYLAGETVLAHPPSAVYRFKKFVRRNRPQVIAAALVVAALVAGVIGTGLGLLEARAQRDIARDESAAKEVARAAEKLRADAEATERHRADAEKQRAVEFRNLAMRALNDTTSEIAARLIRSKTVLSADERESLGKVVERWQLFVDKCGPESDSSAFRAEGQFFVAFLSQKLDRKEIAHTNYLAAMQTQTNLARKFPDNLEYQRQLAWTHAGLGSVLDEDGYLDEALREYRAACAIWSELATRVPASAEYQHELGWIHTALGLVLADLGHHFDARNEYQAALHHSKRLAKQFPNATVYQIDLAGNYCNYGNSDLREGKWRDSLIRFDLAIEILEKICAQEPRDLTARHFLRNSYIGRAEAFGSLGLLNESVRDADRFVELSDIEHRPGTRILRSLIRLHAGMIADAVEELNDVARQKNLAPEQLVLLARSYVMVANADKKRATLYRDRAMPLLQQAVLAGFKDSTAIQRDYALSSLRDKPEFRELVSRLYKQFPPKVERAPPPKAVK